MRNNRAPNQDDFLRSLYPELKAIAARLLRNERAGHTLHSTDLVHEALIRLFDGRPPEGIPTTAFLARAAHQMRYILIDYGRRHNATKRGGDYVRVPFDVDAPSAAFDYDALLAVDSALDQLVAIDPRAHSVVELKFFAGFTNAEAACILDISESTVEQDWQFARLWLFSRLAPVAV